MFRLTLGMLMAMTLALTMGAVALWALPSTVDAQSQRANRSFQANWAEPGSEFRVNVNASKITGPLARLSETLPAGFTYRALQPRGKPD